MVATIGSCFLIEVFLAQPNWGNVADGFVPHLDSSALYIAIGIIGATVMPHNLYLHSALVQSRAVSDTFTGKSEACRFNLLDSVIALNAAFFVNAAILITAAAVFNTRGIEVTEIQQAHKLLENLLGGTIAPIVFAIALLAAGQSSTITGTISGQVVMEGFLNLRMAPWLRRFITRMVALAPAVIAISLAGNEGIYDLLVLSQVVLSLQLPFAIIPLVQFTTDRGKMGPFVNPIWVTLLAWSTAAVIIYLNAKLVIDKVSGWIFQGNVLVWLVVAPLIFLLVMLLGYLLLAPWLSRSKPWISPAKSASLTLANHIHAFKAKRIGVAIEHAEGDAVILSAAIGLARAEKARLFLIHVVDVPGVMLLGSSSGGMHTNADEMYLEDLVREIEDRELPVESMLRFGRPVDEIVKSVTEAGLDLLIMGSHGHSASVGRLVRGETVAGVHHHIRVPLLVVPSTGTEPAIHPVEDGRSY